LKEATYEYNREVLAPYLNQQIEVRADFNRFGSHQQGTSVLIKNITHQQDLISTHIWMRFPKNLKNEIKASLGKNRRFHATVYSYAKSDGSVGYALRFDKWAMK